ncbi:MAG: hypothetical protein GX663_10795 [Clostridiales bacterium]|nr:hypothetical protein [Clostridiales bacterium]
MELLILLVIAVFVISYRYNKGENIYKFISREAGGLYDKYAPYSFKDVREKAKKLGQEYTPRQYLTQVIIFAGVAGGIAYLYFFSILWAVGYALAAISVIPYLAYLKYKRVYSEFIFEQIEVYTSNVIMEFNVTQSFVKALEGVRDSGILEDPVLSDVKMMIDMSYQNGTIDESISYMNDKYPFYIVKNMHQLFNQITKEGARDAGESLENMSMDIDMLVEGVYRDRMDRENFHKRFITFGLALYLLVMAMQFLLGNDSYLELLELWYVQLILHAIIIVNTYFLYKGEKYYHENVGAE